jgi:hypothetical protein
MEKPRVGFYWAKMKRPHRWPSVGREPTVVEFCDEGGDRWFRVMNIDGGIDLERADDDLIILAAIAPPPSGLAIGGEVQMLCSPSCYGKIIDIRQKDDKEQYQVAWEDGPVEWFNAEGLRMID